MMRASPNSFRDFMKRRGEVAQAFVRGDPRPLVAISTQQTPASIFGPGGGMVAGPKQVIGKNVRDSKHFAPGSTSHLKVLHSDADGKFAYWVGLQRAKVNVRGKKSAVPMRLRVTEIYRCEEGEWKLLHRHADMLVTAIKSPKH
jgi:ketosteroid isomerase-like protein